MSARSNPAIEVMHVAETIRGGIATYLREILPRQVIRFGVGRVAVIVPVGQVDDLGVMPGVTILTVRASRVRLLTALRTRLRLHQFMRAHRVRVVHVHSTFAGLICRILRWGALRKVRMVYCPHGWAFSRTGGRSVMVARLLERALSRCCDGIVCVSNDEKLSALHAGLPDEKLHIIRNGLPDRPLLPWVQAGLWQPGSLRLVFIGRLDRQKGFDVLTQALGKLERKVEVHVFGDSVLRDTAAESVPEFLHMQGWKAFSEIEPYLLTCDALVMPSRWEGLPLTALEGMRAGKAVIASNVGGLKEVVDHGVTGFLVPPDDVDALARVLNAIDTNVSSRLGGKGRERFLRDFTIEDCENKLSVFYAS